MPAFKIPFNRPGLAGNEYQYIADAISSGQISGDGKYTKKCQELLQQALGVPKVLLTTSCTHALEMAALLLDLQPEDEFIIPSFTFVSTANAFVLRGAVPRFCDIRADTLNLDESQVKQLITPRTKVIVVVHYAGIGCEMDVVQSIAQAHNIRVVEDNAHGLFAKYRDKYLGTFGNFSTLSFHETKNFTCGEGGALLINDPEQIERAEVIREKGTDRSRFFRGQIDKYTWVDLGSSYLPSDLLAAFLYAQLEQREKIQTKRRSIWNRYLQALSAWASANDIKVPFIPLECEQPYHMFYLIVPSLEIRQAILAHLNSRGILGVFHYLPLHLSKMGKKFGGKPGDCPITESVSERLLRLPFYKDMSEADQDEVIQALLDFHF